MASETIGAEVQLGVTAVAPPAEIVQETRGITVWAQALKINTKDEYLDAAERLKGIKGLAKRITDFFGPMKRAQDEAKRQILEAERKFLTPLIAAEGAAKMAMLAYQQIELRHAREEQARLQADADERARKERERLEAQAAKLKTPEKKADRLEQAQQVVAPVVYVPPGVPKVSGLSTRKHWKMVAVDKNLLVLAAAANPNLLGYLAVDESAINRVLNAMKGQVEIPGVTFREDDIMAAGGR